MVIYGVGVVGAGWVSSEHIKAFSHNPHAEVRAITSRTEASARARAQEEGLDCEIYTDYERMLQQRDIDIIAICTPNHLHAPQGIFAAEAGKHFLIEKPIAINLDELRRLRDAVRKARVKTVCGFVLHWNPLFVTVKSLLQEGTLGKLFYAECDYLHNIGPWYSGFGWLKRKDSGASSLLAGGCHAVDALRWFAGEIAEVTAYSTGPAGEYEYAPTIAGVLKFTSGAIGKVSSCFNLKMPYVFNLELYGDKGTIRNNQLYCDLLAGQTNFATIPTILPDSGDVAHHPFQGEIDHFVSCILEDRESDVNVEDGVKTHEVCLAADLSAAEGRPVRLPLREG